MGVLTLNCMAAAHGQGWGGVGSPGALRAPVGGWVKAVLPLDNPAPLTPVLEGGC